MGRFRRRAVAVASAAICMTTLVIGWAGDDVTRAPLSGAEVYSPHASDLAVSA